MIAVRFLTQQCHVVSHFDSLEKNESFFKPRQRRTDISIDPCLVPATDPFLQEIPSNLADVCLAPSYELISKD